MPRQKRKSKLRPKTPSRVKKRTKKAAGPRSLQHPELWGLGLVALGLFLGSVIYAGWNGGYVGGAMADGLDALIGGASWVVPVAFVAIGALMVTRSALVDAAKADSLWQLLVLQGAVPGPAELLAYAAPTYYGMAVAVVG